MVFADIDKVKETLTDKYVVVDAARPELARFKDVVGRVKTVNMSGRALVEFADYHLNIGWYDIDPAFLKVVDKPPPKPEKPEPKKAEKPVAKKAEAPAAKPAAKPAGGKPSTADILAAARGGAAAAPAKPAAKETASAKAPAAEKPKVDRGKLSTADILAAARGGAAAPVKPAAKQEVPLPPEEPETPSMNPASEETNIAKKPAPAAAEKSSGEKIDKSTMSIDDMITWCRDHDSK